jgi:hypothetical protein
VVFALHKRASMPTAPRIFLSLWVVFSAACGSTGGALPPDTVGSNSPPVVMGHPASGPADVDWAYWALNGTAARGGTRTFGMEETFGVPGTSWTSAALPQLTLALQDLQPMVQHP